MDATVYAIVTTADGGAASGTYSNAAGAGATVGDISVSSPGFDMNGVTAIQFWDTNTDTEVAGTTALTTANWTVDADGDTITIADAVMDVQGLLWHTPTSTTAIRGLKLTTAAGQTVISTAIITAP